MRIIEIFPNWRNAHFDKDIGMLPRQLKKHGWQTTILAKKNEKIIREELQVQQLTGFFFIEALSYLWHHAAKTEVLFLVHTHPLNPFYAAMYKLRNHNGIVYIKADMDESILQLNTFSFLNIIRRIKIQANLIVADIFSIEQERIYKFLAQKYAGQERKMLHLPSGYGDTTTIKIRSFAQKENLIIYVGVVGSRQKATDTILTVIEKNKAKLKGWHMCFVGKIVPEFQEYINEFYKRNPDLKTTVMFHGPTKSRKEMLTFYNRAKILLMPTRWEGFSNVPAEAAHFGCVIIGTPVGGVIELTDNGKIGAICPIDNIRAIGNAVVRFTNQELLAKHSAMSRKHCDAHYTWNAIAPILHKKVSSLQKRS